MAAKMGSELHLARRKKLVRQMATSEDIHGKKDKKKNPPPL